ncbi:hypothetical protein SAMN06295879_1016 [Agreia bicolorata]|uniref:Uncharacterized protein n=1 Tax=Agreia bicolorata TaxID=110935 RepID=A0A1T4XBD3_9MICO|nr:hypothetical protein [Agreia bicolorata]SKA86982.1 hypothetical protein SAMN06295879_1016 [Agreia bicolorata]
MTQDIKQIRPGAETRADEVVAGGLNTSIVTPAWGQSRKAEWNIGASVEGELDRTLWRLVAGDIELYHLTPALAAWWTVAHEQGRRTLQPELEQATADRDRYYEIAFYGRDLGDVRRRRMDEASEDYWNCLMAGDAK